MTILLSEKGPPCSVKITLEAFFLPSPRSEMLSRRCVSLSKTLRNIFNFQFQFQYIQSPTKGPNGTQYTILAFHITPVYVVILFLCACKIWFSAPSRPCSINLLTPPSKGLESLGSKELRESLRLRGCRLCFTALFTKEQSKRTFLQCMNFPIVTTILLLESCLHVSLFILTNQSRER